MKVNIGKYPQGKDVKRKISVKIEKFDLWGFDGSVGYVILEWLKEFRNMKRQGVPGGMITLQQTAEDYDRQSSFDFYKDDNPDFSKAVEEWNSILDKMIWSFDEMINGMNSKCYWDELPEIDFENSKEKILWKVKGKMNEMKRIDYQDRLQEGLDLFAKYMRNLWD